MQNGFSPLGKLHFGRQIHVDVEVITERIVFAHQNSLVDQKAACAWPLRPAILIGLAHRSTSPTHLPSITSVDAFE